MLLINLQILLLGNYYLALIFLMIYLGSIAILFIYILMVLSIISTYKYGYILFIISIFSIFIMGNIIINYDLLTNILYINKELFTILLLPISLILFIAMIFAIRSI